MFKSGINCVNTQRNTLDNQNSNCKKGENMVLSLSLSLFSRRLGIITRFCNMSTENKVLKQKYVYYKEHSILCKIFNVSDDCSTHLCIWQTSPYHDHFSLQSLQVPWWLCFQLSLHDCKHVLYGNSCEKSSCWV